MKFSAISKDEVCKVMSRTGKYYIKGNYLLLGRQTMFSIFFYFILKLVLFLKL